MKNMETITYQDFAKVELRVGKIVNIEDFPEARNPAYKLSVDFGSEIGVKKSSAQIVDLYSKEELQDRLIVAVVNFEPKQIGPFMSECLVTGAPTAEHHVSLLSFEHDIPLGSKIF